MPGPALRRLVIALAVACAATVALTGMSQAQLALYDNFNRGGIDPDKWVGHESFAASLNPNTDASRVIQRRALRVTLTTFGNTDSDSGTQVGRFGLALADPSPVTAMAATVTIVSAVAEDCPDNTAISRARVTLTGQFFNDGLSTGANDRTGDMGATMRQRLDRDGNTFQAAIFRCADAPCNSAPDLFTQVFNTTWTLNQADTLSVQWDPDRNQFLFAVNAGTSTEETVALPYVQSDTRRPVSDFKAIRANHVVANCTDGRKKVSIDAKVDDVKLNPEAVP